MLSPGTPVARTEVRFVQGAPASPAAGAAGDERAHASGSSSSSRSRGQPACSLPPSVSQGANVKAAVATPAWSTRPLIPVS